MPQPDDDIITRLEDLTACLCGEMTPEDAEEPAACLCIPIPGSFPAQAFSGKGEDMGWVRLVDKFPSNAPGQQSPLTYNMVSGFSVIVEIGIARCFDFPDDSMFDEEQLTAIWRQQMRDIGIIDRAIACCATRTWHGNEFIVGNYSSMGPEGNMLMGRVQIAMQL
jgi:hypothetical protein